jgi:hypothetical protein
LAAFTVVGSYAGPTGADSWLLVANSVALTAPIHLPNLSALPSCPVPTNQPIQLVELCGGLAVFLEAFLRCGVHVQRFVYVDSDAAARAVTHHRLQQLRYLYPQQLPMSALCMWDTALPGNVHHITTADLQRLGPVHVVAAGPPCQGFSTAGSRLGWRT